MTIESLSSAVQTMKRVIRLSIILGVAAFLAGCDKCGNFMQLDIFGQPVKSCTGDRPQG